MDLYIFLISSTSNAKKSEIREAEVLRGEGA